ncbi:hypothetical protein RUMCAL_03044 [Ruminococcus callidus ATCC 27760]|uniref:Uncharacterized protein n=1 Tax=Ruminococcus callidus ATCC 27760 TaxID=411473 RepID=U2LHP1_9FIRM|nr:hypothetical protein RUMCAL_03044 [Ruminococcus callidus ATCC 27760]
MQTSCTSRLTRGDVGIAHYTFQAKTKTGCCTSCTGTTACSISTNSPRA